MRNRIHHREHSGAATSMDSVWLDCHHTEGALPLPLAGEGWGGGASRREIPSVERAPTRAFGATSPASGRGCEPGAGRIDLRYSVASLSRRPRAAIPLRRQA
nr:hypothetical protein FNV92_09900 [Bradyrhizobium cosmicum]